MHARGFTLVEFVLVVALGSIVALSMYPMSVALYEAQVLMEVHGGLTGMLRSAQVSALTRKEDSNHGVKVLDGQYVHFVGSSYATRDTEYDHTTNMPDTLQITGVDEIVFLQGTGYPVATGTLTLTYSNETTYIEITEQGLVQ